VAYKAAKTLFLVAVKPYFYILPLSIISYVILETTDRQLHSKQICLALMLFPFNFSNFKALVSRINSLLVVQYFSITLNIFSKINLFILL